jgi:DNA-directed RNA polymerase subunit F
LKNNAIVLREAGNLCKKFTEEEAKLIRDGKQNVTYLTQFFKNKKDSEQRLKDALGDRPIYPEKEMQEMVERGNKLKEEIRVFRE